VKVVCQSAAARRRIGSLTTEYSANGSFFRPHTRSVHGNWRRLALGCGL
jgi:hypothetical protein